MRLWPLLIALIALGSGARADFADYLNKPEPVYKWEKRGEAVEGGVKVYDLHLWSQTWQGIPWEHRLQVYVPDNVQYPHFCGLLNTGGGGSKGDMALASQAAKSMNAVFVVLYNIPNQPLYDNLKEDALIAFTWKKFLETGDESWPLHFPMAKAVIKAMDAVQAWAKSEKLPSIDEFLITGASKRGWTTWLTAASGDRRVKGIAPMVIDTLNLPAQIPHQLEAFGGKPSEQIDDYSSAGLLDIAKTPRGKRLVELEDPYSYRDKLALPKLIVLGTNDRYWAQDALNLYWDGLKGPKWALYNPNVGHGMESPIAQLRIIGSISAFARSLASHKAFPSPTWKFTEDANGLTLKVEPGKDVKSVQFLADDVDDKDFRDSRWDVVPSASPDQRSFTLPRPAAGYAAMFAELKYIQDGRTFSITTQLQIIGSK